MTLNVLADRHHAGLYRSLQLLAARLGWSLHTPYGMDWWTEWVWSFGRSTYNDDRLARQFLEYPASPVDGGYVTTEDEEFPRAPISGVTLERARRERWDIVIASIADNQSGFAKFAREQGAQYVVQCGNTGQYIDWSREPVVLNSSEMPLLGPGITYHQELDPVFVRTREVLTDEYVTDGPVSRRVRVPAPDPDPCTVRSFVHLMNETHAFPIWNQMRAELDGYTFERFGHAPPSEDPTYRGNAKPIDRIAALMATAGWGFHDKPVGDGFGHVVHGWAAVGRPLIGHGSHYRGKLAEPFWQDGVTCIDLDKHTVAEAVEIVRAITPDVYRAMCAAIRAEYDRIDYAAEAAAIADLLRVGVPA